MCDIFFLLWWWLVHPCITFFLLSRVVLGSVGSTMQKKLGPVPISLEGDIPEDV